MTTSGDMRVCPHSRLGVSPGHYGHLLKMVERPEGKYPVSMAMLDLLATTCHPSNSAVSREQVASVAYVMREVFSCCHKWKFRTRSAREELGEGVSPCLSPFL